MSELFSILGIHLPIIQAPMAGVSTPEMAAAVSNAGGLGSIGVGNVDARAARAMIRAVRAKTDLPFNVNVFCHTPAVSNAARESAWLARLTPVFQQLGAQPPHALHEIYKSFVEDDEMLEALLSERPAVVSFHFGLPPSDRIQALQSAGIRLLASATNLPEGRAISDAGIDAVIAQGYEAGGHRGMFDPFVADEQLGTMALTRLLVTNFSLPVIAAGGIMDGSGIAAALALGAVAAQLGTAFILCSESAADAGYRQAMLERPSRATFVTRAISGRPARSLFNRFTEFGKAVTAEEIPEYPIAYDAGKALHAAAKATGEYGYGAQWAGQGAALTRVMPAGELVQILWRECKDAVAQLGTL